MRVTKPNDVMLILGRQSQAGQSCLTITVGYVCQIDGTRLTEQQAWAWLAPQFAKEPFDLGEKKRRGGYAVAGCACAPINETCNGLMIHAGVGELHKSLVVQGNRRWRRQVGLWQATTPEPFERMPIDLSHAYGAPGWPQNPYGVGHAVTADTVHGSPLPNVEHPDHPILKPSDEAPVITLGLLPQASPERLRWLGTLDDTWRRERHPWLPDDTDPRWFDRIAQDQCRDTYWRGDEPWFAENMHPQYPVMQGRLPGLRPRVLVRAHRDPQPAAAPDTSELPCIEIPMDLDTVWLFPTDERVIVLYRGIVSTRREDAEDIKGVAVFTEQQQDPAHSTEHWTRVWMQQEARSEVPTKPTAVPTPSNPSQPAAAASTAGTFAESIQQQIATARQDIITQAEEISQKYGLPPLKPANVEAELSAPLSSHWPAEPGAFSEAVRTHIAQQMSAAETQARDFARAHGLDCDAIVARAKAQASTGKTDPMTWVATAASAFPDDKAQDLLTRYQEFDKDIAALRAKADGLRSKTQALRSTQLSAQPSSPETEAAPALPTVTNRTTMDKTTLLARHAAGQSCAWALIEGVDLTDVSLQGIQLSHAVLRRCHAQGADFDRADFREATLEQCDFSDAQLRHAAFNRAQLTDCTLTRIKAEGADFSQARLVKISLAHSTLRQTRWVETQAKECVFDQASIQRAVAEHARFTACQFSELDASESRCGWVVFEQCTLRDASFENARLDNATFLACKASRTRMRQAQLGRLRVLKGTDLRHADLDHAQLDHASLQDSNLAHVTLREAHMDNALIKNCDLTGSNAWRLVARSANFTGSHLVQASWRGANLMHTRWSEAVLQDVDMVGVNLHAADTRRVKAQGVQLKQALMTRCRLIEDYANE